MERLINIFGGRVRWLRKSKGMTLEALASAAKVGYKHVAEIERGVKVPSFEMIERLAAALDLNQAYSPRPPGNFV
jgi:transcriptional regulator with XRE-family HTH domain